MATVLDTNILVDMFKPNPEWYSWSLEQYERHWKGPNSVLVNSVVIGEFAAGSQRALLAQQLLASGWIKFDNIPTEAAIAAGVAYRDYLDRGGTKRTVLADFLIGAHAASGGHTLVTRDPKRYRQAYPGLTIVSP